MLSECPGLYCGRILLDNGTFSDCGACPSGFRVNYLNSECITCDESPTFYDSLYILFMVLLLIISEWYIIDDSLKRRNFTLDVLLLHLSAAVENVIAIILTLIMVPPVGTFKIKSCGVKRLSDWYTLFFNPTPGYQKTLRCTQEATFPLYTMIFIFYMLALLLLLILRPIVLRFVADKKGTQTIYLTMYVIPALGLIHATLCGLLYYSFPYVTIVGSIISIASHFAFRLDQRIGALILSTITDLRSIIILIGHWALHAYGLIALTELKRPLFHGSLLLLVPFPTIFYILTSKFTDPNKLQLDQRQ